MGVVSRCVVSDCGFAALNRYPQFDFASAGIMSKVVIVSCFLKIKRVPLKYRAALDPRCLQLGAGENYSIREIAKQSSILMRSDPFWAG